MIYNIRVYTDMGNLLTASADDNQIPAHIAQFIREKINMYVDVANDNKGAGCLFHLLKPGYVAEWHYYHMHDIVNIKWELDTFFPNFMEKRRSIKQINQSICNVYNTY
jgi:hypothetical protein